MPPGRPDIVLPKYKAVIFVNGCFWHMHNCSYFTMPKTRADFWRKKLTANKDRDERNVHALLDLGWRVLICWECAIRDQSDQAVAKLVDLVAEWTTSSEVTLEFDGEYADQN